jgi:hypothetical protein
MMREGRHPLQSKSTSQTHEKRADFEAKIFDLLIIVLVVNSSWLVWIVYTYNFNVVLGIGKYRQFNILVEAADDCR